MLILLPLSLYSKSRPSGTCDSQRPRFEVGELPETDKAKDAAATAAARPRRVVPPAHGSSQTATSYDAASAAAAVAAAGGAGAEAAAEALNSYAIDAVPPALLVYRSQPQQIGFQ